MTRKPPKDPKPGSKNKDTQPDQPAEDENTEPELTESASEEANQDPEVLESIDTSETEPTAELPPAPPEQAGDQTADLTAFGLSKEAPWNNTGEQAQVPAPAQAPAMAPVPAAPTGFVPQAGFQAPPMHAPAISAPVGAPQPNFVGQVQDGMLTVDQQLENLYGPLGFQSTGSSRALIEAQKAKLRSIDPQVAAAAIHDLKNMDVRIATNSNGQRAIRVSRFAEGTRLYVDFDVVSIGYVGRRNSVRCALSTNERMLGIPVQLPGANGQPGMIANVVVDISQDGTDALKERTYRNLTSWAQQAQAGIMQSIEQRLASFQQQLGATATPEFMAWLAGELRQFGANLGQSVGSAASREGVGFSRPNLSSPAARNGYRLMETGPWIRALQVRIAALVAGELIRQNNQPVTGPPAGYGGQQQGNYQQGSYQQGGYQQPQQQRMSPVQATG